MALKELKKEMRHCAVSPLIFLWREYLSYKVFPERKLGQQPCDEVAQCEGTEGQRQDEPRCAQFHGLQYVEKDGVEHDDVQQVNAITQARQPVDETVARGFLPGDGFAHHENPESHQYDVRGTVQPRQFHFLHEFMGERAVVERDCGNSVTCQKTEQADAEASRGIPVQVVADVMRQYQIADETGEIPKAVELVPVAFAEHVACPDFF